MIGSCIVISYDSKRWIKEISVIILFNTLWTIISRNYSYITNFRSSSGCFWCSVKSDQDKDHDKEILPRKYGLCSKMLFFKAPSGGIYVVDWKILAWQSLYVYANTLLFLNDQLKSMDFIRDVNFKTWLPCSKMKEAKLNQGERD